jgi:hypothetical protein
MRRPVLATVLLLSAPAWTWAQPTFTLGASTAQVDRGRAYIDRPLAEASASYYSEQGWFGGVSASSTLHGEHQSGLSGFAGYARPLADDLTAQLALSRHRYRGRMGVRYDYDEATLTLNYRDRLFVSVSRLFDVVAVYPYAPEMHGHAMVGEAVWRQPLPHGLSLLAGVGHTSARMPGRVGYLYGNLSLTAPVGKAKVEVSYIATDAEAKRSYGSRAANRWVGSVRWHF